ncbi:unnamed protein product, partial [Lymnaea stagnalis]
MVCDHVSQCQNKRDELICNYRKCDSLTEFTCTSGQCVPLDAQCDLFADCVDKSDEEKCIKCRNGLCHDGRCLPKHWFADGEVDCNACTSRGDVKAEIASVPDDNIAQCVFTCNRTQCTYVSMLGDGDRYDGLLGCRDLVHLQNCDNFVCPEGYIKCPRSVCLHPDNVCDGHPHCPLGDDEISCAVTCRSGFQCLGAVVVVKNYDLSIPLNDLNFIDHRTRYMDLTGVNISSVFPEFPKGHFYNLMEMYLSHCGITHVDAVTYSQNDLWSVIYADLSYNEITSIGVTSIFRYMVSLKSLNLSRNTGLSYLHPDTFNTYGMVSQLTSLDLSHTSVTAIHYTLLVPLLSLQDLSLRGTKISDMRQDMFPEDYVLQVLDLRELNVQQIYANTFKFMTVKSHFYTDTFKLCCPQLHNDKTPMYVCDAPQDPFSSCSDLMGEPILRVLLWLFGCLAVIGNIVVIMYRLTYDRNILKMAYGHFVMHLSISDMFMGIYLLIVAVADSYYRGTYVWGEMEWRNSIACRTAGFLSTLSSEVSTFFIFLITIDRFLVIKFPFGQLKMSGPVIITCCALAWVIGLTIAITPLLPPFKHWTTYCSNGMCLGLPLMNRRLPGWEFSTTVFIFLNLFLFIIIAVGQLIIYRTMANMRMGHGALTNTSYRRVQDFEVAKHLSLIAISNFCCWFPIGVMGLLALNGHQLGMEAYAWSAVLIMPLNSAINPLIYTIPALMQRWSELMF